MIYKTRDRQRQESRGLKGTLLTSPALSGPCNFAQLQDVPLGDNYCETPEGLARYVCMDLRDTLNSAPRFRQALIKKDDRSNARYWVEVLHWSRISMKETKGEGGGIEDSASREKRWRVRGVKNRERKEENVGISVSEH